MLSTLFSSLNNYLTPSFSEELSERLSSHKLRFLALTQIEFDVSGDLLKQIIEENYRDGIDGFEGVKNDGSKITGTFLDVVNSKLTKRYRFEVSENKIFYQLENLADVKKDASYSEIDFARTKMFGQSKQPKKCVKGDSCGNTCIKSGLPCNKPPNPQQKQAIASLLKNAVQSAVTAAKSLNPANNVSSTSNFEQLKYGAKVKRQFDEWEQFLSNVGDKDGNRGANKDIASIIKDDLAVYPAKRKNFIGIADKKGNLQASAIIIKNKDHIEVDLLATAPWNAGGDDPRQTKGAGTAAIEAIIQKSIDSGFGGRVKLTSLPGAVKFYEKIGFKSVNRFQSTNKNGDIYDDMELDENAAKAFLKKRGK
jgi:hypothetical protein